MMRLQRTAPLLALALLAGAVPAAAQTIPSPYEHIEQSQRLGIIAGYLLLSPDLAIDDTTAIGVAPQSAPVFGIRYAIRVAPPLEFQTSLWASPSRRELWTVAFSADSLIATPTSQGESVAATLVGADLGLRLGLTGDRTWNRLAPFVGASAGIVADIRGSFEAEDGIPDDALYRLGPSFALAANLGTDWFPAPNASLRLELQGQLWRLSAPEGFTPLRATSQSEWNPGARVSVGAAIHF